MRLLEPGAGVLRDALARKNGPINVQAGSTDHRRRGRGLMPRGGSDVKVGMLRVTEPAVEVRCAALDLLGAVVGVGRAGARVCVPRSRRGPSTPRCVLRDAVGPRAGGLAAAIVQAPSGRSAATWPRCRGPP